MESCRTVETAENQVVKATELCAEDGCFLPAVLILNNVARCIQCHRDANGGRIV